MATSDFAREIAMMNVVERVETWVMPVEDEELTLEIKDLEQKLDDDEDEDNILGDIIWLFSENDTVECTVEVGSGEAAAVVPTPSEKLGPAEQGQGLQQAEDLQVPVQHQKADLIPSAGETDTTMLDGENGPDTTISAVLPRKNPRGRTIRRLCAATWKGAKRVLLCGCFRRS